MPRMKATPPSGLTHLLGFWLTVSVALFGGACGNSSRAPDRPAPTSAQQPATAPAPTGAAATPAAVGPLGQTQPASVPNVGGRPIAMPTPEIGFGKTDVAFLPLNDDTGEGFYMTWELRYYPRAAVTALLAPHVSFTTADYVAVDQKIWALKSESWKPFPASEAARLGRTFNARFVVHPSITKTDGAGLDVTLAVIETGTGREIGSARARGAKDNVSPHEAQRILLGASFEAAAVLARALGNEVEIPKQGTPSLPGSVDVLKKAEILCRRWNPGATLGALDKATIATKYGPADGRAWAMAARCYGRLALDTDVQVARFHRECRLRANVAADLAQRYAPEDRDIDGEIDTLLDMTEVRARLMRNDIIGVEPILRRMKLYAPFSTRTYLCEALLNLRTGNIEAARSAIEVVRRCHPDATAARVAYARLLAAEKQLDQALGVLEKATRDAENPWDLIEVGHYAAKFLESSGQKAKAREVWERQIEMWPKGWWTEEARKGIQRTSVD